MDLASLVSEPEFCGMVDVEGGTPRSGDVLARYMAVAYLGDGELKREIYRCLTEEDDGAAAARQVMVVKAHASRKNAAEVPLCIANDLIEGVAVDEIFRKPYRYLYERWFYAPPDAVPKEDKHWTVIGIYPKDAQAD